MKDYYLELTNVNIIIIIILLLTIILTTFFITKYAYTTKCVDISKYDNKFKNQQF